MTTQLTDDEALLARMASTVVAHLTSGDLSHFAGMRAVLAAVRAHDAAKQAARQPIPDDELCMEAMDGRDLQMYDYACAQANDAVTRILDGKDSGEGSCNEPWATLRKRLLALMKQPATEQAAPELEMHSRLVKREGSVHTFAVTMEPVEQAAQPVAYSIDLNGHDDYLCWADVATSTYADRPMRGLVWSDASPPPPAAQPPKALLDAAKELQAVLELKFAMQTVRSDPYYITEADRMEAEYERRKEPAWVALRAAIAEVEKDKNEL